MSASSVDGSVPSLLHMIQHRRTMGTSLKDDGGMDKFLKCFFLYIMIKRYDDSITYFQSKGRQQDVKQMERKRNPYREEYDKECGRSSYNFQVLLDKIKEKTLTIHPYDYFISFLFQENLTEHLSLEIETIIQEILSSWNPLWILQLKQTKNISSIILLTDIIQQLLFLIYGGKLRPNIFKQLSFQSRSYIVLYIFYALIGREINFYALIGPERHKIEQMMKQIRSQHFLFYMMNHNPVVETREEVDEKFLKLLIEKLGHIYRQQQQQQQGGRRDRGKGHNVSDSSYKSSQQQGGGGGGGGGGGEHSSSSSSLL